MAKSKGGTRRAARRAKNFFKRRTPRGGRMSVMFKTAIAVTGAALVGGAALQMVNTAKGKPTEGMTAGIVSGGAGLLLAFSLGLFKGTRQYVTPVLAGAAAVGALNAFSGPISRGSANIAKALLGEGGGGELKAASSGDKKPLPLNTGVNPKPAKASKGEQLLQLGTSLANLGAGIAGAIQQGNVKAAAGLAASAGLSDFNVGSGADDDDIEGAEGMDDFAIIGSSVMGEDDDE